MSDVVKKPKVIFFGNGPLAEYALAVISQECQVIFRARTCEDLAEVCELKREHPEAHGVLASFGVIIKPAVLDLFEPEGILNIHPSLLPLYRGASPIESAILAGDNEFSVSVMKLVKAMDAGPIYYQATFGTEEIKKIASAATEVADDNFPSKAEIYQVLAEAGAKWICEHLNDLPKPIEQDETRATFCGKLDKSMGALTPETDTADLVLRKIVAYQGFPKPKYAFYDVPCIVLEAHICKPGETALLAIPCVDGAAVAVDRLQPEGRKPMDAKSFLNGYAKK